MRRVNVLVVLLLPLLAGCFALGRGEPSPYVKGAPVVFIHPLADVYRDATVGVLAFQMPSNARAGQGEAVGALFRDVFLGKQVFKKIRLLPTPYGDLDEAVEAGAAAHVDLVLAGRVNQAFTGGSMGGNRVDVTVRLVNVHTGNTVWHVAEAVEQPVEYPAGDFLGRVAEAMTFPEIRPVDRAPAVPNMLVRVAEDMSEVLAGAKTVVR